MTKTDYVLFKNTGKGCARLSFQGRSRDHLILFKESGLGGEGTNPALTSVRGRCLPTTVVTHHRHLGWPMPRHSAEFCLLHLCSFTRLRFVPGGKKRKGLEHGTAYCHILYQLEAPASGLLSVRETPRGTPRSAAPPPGSRADRHCAHRPGPLSGGLSPACGLCCRLTGFPCRLFKGYPSRLLTDPSPNVKPFPSGPHPVTNQDRSIKTWPLEPNSKEQ